jgi:hypothetical protein
VLWSIWTLRNHYIFRAPRAISVNTLFFSILHLFSYWTDASISVNTELTGAGSAVNTSAVGPTGQPGVTSLGDVATSNAGPARDPISDEDLLD